MSRSWGGLCAIKNSFTSLLTPTPIGVSWAPMNSTTHASAIAAFAKMSAPVRAFVAALYEVRDDRIALQHTFDTQRPPNTALTLWEAAAIADTVRGLPEGWSP